MTSAQPSQPRLRSDAQRNAEHIRNAAIDAFRARGLGVPLQEVARAAGVSKATIFNRFGGRVGLIEAVIEELVTTELHTIAEHTRAITDPGQRVRHYITAIRDLQYREPATNDVLLQEYPHSHQLMEICRTAGQLNEELITQAHAAGALHPDYTAHDLQAQMTDNALALKHGTRPPRQDYDRRTAFLLDGIGATQAATRD